MKVEPKLIPDCTGLWVVVIEAISENEFCYVEFTELQGEQVVSIWDLQANWRAKCMYMSVKHLGKKFGHAYWYFCSASIPDGRRKPDQAEYEKIWHPELMKLFDK